MNTRPAMREPMVWVVIGLPLVAVIAAFWLLAAAITSGGADEISDAVQSAGEAQVADLGPDVRAQTMKLSAVLHMGAATIDVYPVKGDFARNQVLILTLSHPTDASQDRRFVLKPDEVGWHIPGDVRAGHDWIAQLAPMDQHWRLRGRIKAGQLAARLDPASATD